LIKPSDGRARRINLLADKALLAAYAQGERSVEPSHVDTAVKELPIDRFPSAAPPPGRWRFAAASLALAVVMTIGAVGVIEWYRRPQPKEAAADSKPPATVFAAVTPEPTHRTVTAPISPPPVAPSVAAIPSTPQATEIADTRFNAVLVRTKATLQKNELDGYTIQLAALPSNTSPDRYLEQIATQLELSKVYARYSVYKGMTFMSVYYGKFESYSAAASAIKSLPAALKNNRPLVRTWIKIKEDQAP
jgi:MSHA biogenesis protein MshM